jgi:putative ABC transport system substrate-binding protein
MPVIGYIGSSAPDAYFQSMKDAFLRGLGETGYVEGKNLSIEYRWAEGHYDRLPALAADLARRKVDLIVASGGSVSARAAKDATSTIPVVFTSVSDAVGEGLVASLARPGGNVTGVSHVAAQLTPKRLELLSALMPPAGLIGLLVNPAGRNYRRIVAEVQEGARATGHPLLVLNASSEGEIGTAFATAAQEHVGAVVVDADAFFTAQRKQLVALAARHAIPAIYTWREHAAIGGLMSYGASITGAYRQAGVYAGRVLKGARPSDLPVEQPTTFELVINMKTAKALGLTIPPSILARADEVIE